MRRAAEKARRLILQVPNVQKVELLGVQEEKVYVEIENASWHLSVFRQRQYPLPSKARI